MFYYQAENEILFSRQALTGFREIDVLDAQKAPYLTYISQRPGTGRTVYCINHPGYLADAAEGLWCLDRRQLESLAQGCAHIPAWLAEKALAGHIRGICAASEQLPALLAQQRPWAGKKRVHIVAMGDVGGTLLMGLSLLGGDCIGEIGIYDFNQALCQRWEHEMNQIAYPWDYDRLPTVTVLEQRQLFQCDVLVFCASKAIPPVGAAVQDVRMAQLEANSAIISQYGKAGPSGAVSGLVCRCFRPSRPIVSAGVGGPAIGTLLAIGMAKAYGRSRCRATA